MDEELYEIAKENLKNKRRAGWVSVIGVAVFFIFFSYWLNIDMAMNWLWLIMVPVLVLRLGLAFYSGQKVVGRKDPVLEEMKRLKNTVLINLCLCSCLIAKTEAFNSLIVLIY